MNDRRIADRRYRMSEAGKANHRRDRQRRKAAMAALGVPARLVRERPIRVYCKTQKRSISVTVDQFVAMDESQDFCCAICGGEMNPPNIDHCHDSSRIRGLLCRNCNSGIGLLGDDPQRMAAAAAYVSANMV